MRNRVHQLEGAGKFLMSRCRNRCNASWKISTTRSSYRELRWYAQPSVLTRRFAHDTWIIRVVLLFLLTWSCLAADNPAGKDGKPKPAQSIDELRQQIE